LVVRVKLRIKVLGSDNFVEAAVLANGGAESPRPCLVIDQELAKKLGIELNRLKTCSVEEASIITEAKLAEKAVEIELLDGDELLSKTIADLVIQRDLVEPLITDITIDELGIQVLSFSKGLWRHVNDPPQKIRRSV